MELKEIKVSQLPYEVFSFKILSIYDSRSMIISNPPFKNKRLFFERALSFNKPFALIMTNAALNDKYPVWCWNELDKQFQILKFDKRMKFTNNENRPNDKIAFSSSYFCYDFLPKDFIQKELQIDKLVVPKSNNE